MISPILGRSQAPSTTADSYTCLNYPYLQTGATLANIAQSEQPMPDSGTLSNFFYRVAVAPGAGATWTVNLLKNGVATLTVTITDPNLTAVDTGSVAYSAGDLFCIEVKPSTGTAPAAPGLASWDITNDSSGQALLTGVNTTNNNSADTWLGLQGSVRTTTITSMETICPTDGVIDNLYVSVNGTMAAARSYTATLVKNGVDTALTATVTNTQLINSELTVNVSVSAGDLLLWRITPTASPTVRSVKPSVRFTPTIDGESIQTYASQSNINSATAEHFMQGAAGGPLVTNGTQGNRLNFPYGVYTIRKLHAAVDTAPGAGKSWAIKIRSNSANTIVATTIADAATTATPDTTNIATSTSGGNLGFSWLGTGTPTLSPSRASYVTYRVPQSPNTNYGAVYLGGFYLGQSGYVAPAAAIIATGSDSGDSTASGTLVRTLYGSVSASGDSTAVSSDYVILFLSATENGDSTASASLIRIVLPSASISGDSTTTGSIDYTAVALASISGDATATSSSLATIFFYASISGDAVAFSTDLAGIFILPGAIVGDAISVGSLRRTALMLASASGDSQSAGLLYLGQILEQYIQDRSSYLIGEFEEAVEIGEADSLEGTYGLPVPEVPGEYEEIGPTTGSWNQA